MKTLQPGFRHSNQNLVFDPVQLCYTMQTFKTFTSHFCLGYQFHSNSIICNAVQCRVVHFALSSAFHQPFIHFRWPYDSVGLIIYYNRLVAFLKFFLLIYRLRNWQSIIIEKGKKKFTLWVWYYHCIFFSPILSLPLSLTTLLGCWQLYCYSKDTVMNSMNVLLNFHSYVR